MNKSISTYSWPGSSLEFLCRAFSTLNKPMCRLNVRGTSNTCTQTECKKEFKECLKMPSWKRWETEVFLSENWTRSWRETEAVNNLLTTCTLIGFRWLWVRGLCPGCVWSFRNTLWYDSYPHYIPDWWEPMKKKKVTIVIKKTIHLGECAL